MVVDDDARKVVTLGEFGVTLHDYMERLATVKSMDDALLFYMPSFCIPYVITTEGEARDLQPKTGYEGKYGARGRVAVPDATAPPLLHLPAPAAWQGGA